MLFLGMKDSDINGKKNILLVKYFLININLFFGKVVLEERFFFLYVKLLSINLENFLFSFKEY